jgi:hypothetical protein
MVISTCLSLVYSVIFNGLYSIPLIIGLILLAPWPSHWRVQWELRGYGMSLAVVQWIINSSTNHVKESVIDNFIKSDYYFMGRNKKCIENQLSGYMQEAKNGSLQKEEPYKFVFEFLNKRGLINVPF